MATVLGKVCTACGKERKKKSILYDPDTFLPYCENPYMCGNPDHPNTPENIIARGSVVKLLPLEVASVNFGEWVASNNPDPETSERIRRMVTQPITLRIGDPGLAQFILDFQKEYKFDNVSETIRYCIQKMREDKDGILAEQVKRKEIKAEGERTQRTHREVQKALSQPEPKDIGRIIL